MPWQHERIVHSPSGLRLLFALPPKEHQHVHHVAQKGLDCANNKLSELLVPDGAK